MATATTKARSLTPEENEEFLAQLGKGGELLAAGKVSEAKPHLERAHQLHPKNDKGQNLLGLTYFKLGIYDRAAEIYEKLVMDNPADPTLRVNLGLVYLKTSALQRAVREFETATDLAPEHRKSHSYLGLALAQAGEYARAKEHFILAGSEAMAEKMSRALAGEGFGTPAPPKAI
ncbi:MAG: tetratricopeptide repeat protein, partial [Myxococcaceae bacterium]